MNNQLENLDLINLFSAKYFKLKKLNEQMWSSSYNISITSSEWFILSLIYGKQPTISEITLQVNTSRQATHKSIQALKSKGLIVINNVANNNRNKCLELTPLGIKFFLENKRLKEDIEKTIITNIGDENVHQLKNLLKLDWIK
jgi:DNA-binding MarR family transcriptional regulator